MTRHLLSSSFALLLCLQGGTAIAKDTLFSPSLISDVAEKVTPAVVNVITRRNRSAAQMPLQHPFFRDFFGPDSQQRLPPEMGAGSGVLISADGQIVTNNHVVEGADEIKVTFADQREFKAKLIGTDKASDLAFLQISAKNTPFLRLGNSDRLRLGEIVLAVGNPFGVGQTVTMGIVSAKGRAKIGIVDYEDFIQTDASINPGNSGGALVDLEGNLVGVNTAILSKSGSAAGIGFAVPSAMVGPIRDQILKHGRVRRGWLGVAIQDLSKEIAESLDLKNIEGVLISDVMDGGPAAKAGIDAGDVVTALEGEKTNSSAQLRNRVALMPPGSKVRLKVQRKNNVRDVIVTLQEKPEDEQVAANGGEAEGLLSGLAIDELSPQLRSRIRVPARVQGVAILQVEPGSPADRAGLEPGDVVTAVNRQPIRTVKELQARIRPNAESALLRVYKRGIFTFVVLRR